MSVRTLFQRSAHTILGLCRVVSCCDIRLARSRELQRRGDAAYAEAVKLRAAVAERARAKANAEADRTRLQASRAEEQLRVVRAEIASLRCVAQWPLTVMTNRRFRRV